MSVPDDAMPDSSVADVPPVEGDEPLLDNGKLIELVNTWRRRSVQMKRMAHQQPAKRSALLAGSFNIRAILWDLAQATGRPEIAQFDRSFDPYDDIA